MATGYGTNSEPFGNRVFIAATVLDPNFKLLWLEDVHVGEVALNKDQIIQDLKKQIQGQCWLIEKNLEYLPH